jgi:hypothetical protein
MLRSRADEAIDKSALEAMALVEAEHGTKEAEKDAEAKKKKKLADAKKLLLLLKEQLLEYERTDRPRRRATSSAMLESIQNKITIQLKAVRARPRSLKEKPRPAKRRARETRIRNAKRSEQRSRLIYYYIDDSM